MKVLTPVHRQGAESERWEWKGRGGSGRTGALAVAAHPPCVNPSCQWPVDRTDGTSLLPHSWGVAGLLQRRPGTDGDSLASAATGDAASPLVNNVCLRHVLRCRSVRFSSLLSVLACNHRFCLRGSVHAPRISSICGMCPAKCSETWKTSLPLQSLLPISSNV